MRKAGVVYFLMNAPLSTVSSSLPGVSVLIATVYLNYIGEPERAGELRLYLSYFALIALLFLTESAKLVIRSVIREERDNIAELVGLRVWISVALLLAGAVAFALLEAGIVTNPSFAVIPIVSALYYPSELYTPVLQATQRFRLLTLLNLAKHLISTTFLLIAIWLDVDMLTSFAGYMLLNAAIGFVYALVVTEIFRGVPGKVRRADIVTPPVREAFVLTVANAVPYSLEHVDKLIVSALFGNAVLGVYSLGFSAGRLLYSLLKPTIFIYYYRFVTALPDIRTLAACFIGGTVLGGSISFAMREFSETAHFGFFEPALLVNAIVLWSYGIALVNTIYTQAVMINENSRAGLVLVANVVGGFVCLAMFGVSTLTDYRTSLALLAAHFPVRHLVSFTIMRLGVRRQ